MVCRFLGLLIRRTVEVGHLQALDVMVQVAHGLYLVPVVRLQSHHGVDYEARLNWRWNVVRYRLSGH